MSGGAPARAYCREFQQDPNAAVMLHSRFPAGRLQAPREVLSSLRFHSRLAIPERPDESSQESGVQDDSVIQGELPVSPMFTQVAREVGGFGLPALHRRSHAAALQSCELAR